MTGDVSAMVHQALLGDAWEHADVAVAIFADDQRYVACNEAFCRLTGHSRAEIVRMRVGVDLAVDEQAHRKVVGEIFASKRTTATVDLRRKDGSTVKVNLWAIETRTAGLPYFIVLHWPVSQRPKLRDIV